MDCKFKAYFEYRVAFYLLSLKLLACLRRIVVQNGKLNFFFVVFTKTKKEQQNLTEIKFLKFNFFS